MLSAAVVIGALRVNYFTCISTDCPFTEINIQTSLNNMTEEFYRKHYRMCFSLKSNTIPNYPAEKLLTFFSKKSLSFAYMYRMSCVELINGSFEQMSPDLGC